MSVLRRLARRLIWVLRLACALLGGAVVRHARRWLRRSPRVWQGTFPMHMLRDMVKVARLGGFPGGSLVFDTRLNAHYDLVTTESFDVVLDERGYGWDERHWAAIEHLAWRADIFVSFFDTRFAPATRSDLLERRLRLLRWAGIRLILVPNGLDVFTLDGRTTRFGFPERLQRDYPEWDLAGESRLTRARLRALCRAADLVVAANSATARFLPRVDLTFGCFSIDTDAWSVTSPTANVVPLIVHAPNHRFVKGTDHLLAAADSLRRAGFRFDLKLVERTPPSQARELYARADLIADQFCIGAHGMFALEGLSLGKPVLVYLDQEQLGDPAFDLPFVNAHPENLARCLAALLEVSELRTRLGRAGREAVDKYQSLSALSEVWSRLYRHVWWGTPLALEETRHFSPQRRARGFSEDPAEASFWPVPVDDLKAPIGSALACLASAER